MRRLTLTVSLLLLFAFTGLAAAAPLTGNRPAQWPVPRAVIRPSVSGSAVIGQTLTGHLGKWKEAKRFAYGWEQCPTNGLACHMISHGSLKHVVTSTDSGYRLRIYVFAYHGSHRTLVFSLMSAAVPGSSGGSGSGGSGGDGSKGAAPVNTAVPTLTGTAKVGSAVTASTGTWSNSPTSYSYSWQSCTSSSGSGCTAISGALSQSYTPVAADVGKFLKATVTAQNSSGSTSASTALSAAVVASAAGPTNTALPTITGTVAVGQTLTASTGTWTGTGLTYSYAWSRCLSGSCTVISGATTSTYQVASADGGYQLEAAVTATDSSSQKTTATSAMTSAVPASGPTNTALPTISGTTTVGQQLAVTQGTWTGSPTSYSYSWNRCNSSGASCVAITGATSSTYTLVSADQGQTISATVKATNASGNASATSAVTATIAASGGGSGGSGGSSGGTIGSALPAAIAGPKAGGAVYYVSTTGNDSSSGSLSAPFLTINHALSKMAAGDIVYVRAGTYQATVLFTRTGTSSATFNLLAYPGETPVIEPPVGGSAPGYALEITGSYERVSGFKIDGAIGTDTAAVYVSGQASNDELSNNEITGSSDQGVSLDSTTSNIDILANTIHDNGVGAVGQHDSNGIVLQGSSQLVANNVIYSQAHGSGIMVAPSCSGSTIVNNTIDGNLKDGIALGGVSVSGIIIRNNLLTNNGGYGIDKIGTVASSFADHNMFFNNVAGTYPASFSNIDVSGGNTIADPSYTNRGAFDYTLTAYSPALTVSALAYTPTTDRIGQTRPIGNGPDLGAYER